ncbi:MAG: hypothetical protein IJJ85_04570 [Clostridia bacterium]|nr:hypothetical protein [Clostridia bacterium]
MDAYCTKCGTVMQDGHCPNCNPSRAQKREMKKMQNTQVVPDAYGGYTTFVEPTAKKPPMQNKTLFIIIGAAAAVVLAAVLIIIAIVSKFKKIKVDAVDPSYYNAVVDAYQKAADSGFTACDDKYVSPSVIKAMTDENAYTPPELRYTFLDINNDGRKELLVAAGQGDDFQIYDIYSCSAEPDHPVRLCQLSEDNTCTYALLKDHSFLYITSDLYANTFRHYQLPAGEAAPVLTDGLVSDAGFFRLTKNEKKKSISEEEYQNALDAFNADLVIPDFSSMTLIEANELPEETTGEEETAEVVPEVEARTPDNAPYSEILAGYGYTYMEMLDDGEADGIDTETYSLALAQQLKDRTVRQMYYALADLNGDGQEELFIGAPDQDGEVVIFAIYTTDPGGGLYAPIDFSEFDSKNTIYLLSDYRAAVITANGDDVTRAVVYALEGNETEMAEKESYAHVGTTFQHKRADGTREDIDQKTYEDAVKEIRNNTASLSWQQFFDASAPLSTAEEVGQTVSAASGEFDSSCPDRFLTGVFYRFHTLWYNEGNGVNCNFESATAQEILSDYILTDKDIGNVGISRYYVYWYKMDQTEIGDDASVYDAAIIKWIAEKYFGKTLSDPMTFDSTGGSSPDYSLKNGKLAVSKQRDIDETVETADGTANISDLKNATVSYNDLGNGNIDIEIRETVGDKTYTYLFNVSYGGVDETYGEYWRLHNVTVKAE